MPQRRFILWGRAQVRRLFAMASRGLDAVWLPVVFTSAVVIVIFSVGDRLRPRSSEAPSSSVTADVTSHPSDLEIRRTPRAIEPSKRYRESVDEHALQTILSKLEPCSSRRFPSVVMATHALRLWGATAEFPEGAYVPQDYHHTVWRFSAPTLVRFLSDHDSFAGFYPDAEPLLRSTPNGIAVRFKVGNFMDIPIDSWPDCEAHVDKVLSVFGEIGLAVDFPVHAPGRMGTIEDLVRDSCMRFVPEQEIEFSIKSYLYYLELPSVWTNRHGTQVDLNDMLRVVTQRELGEGACAGIHLCQVAALALHIDEQTPFLDSTREDLENFLRLVSKRLVQSQEASGAWPADWPMANKAQDLVRSEGQPAARLRATGHHLEWIAIAPQSVCPPDETVEKAIRFLQETLSTLPGDNYYHNYNSLTHAGRALALLLGDPPAAQRLPAAHKLKEP